MVNICLPLTIKLENVPLMSTINQSTNQIFQSNFCSYVKTSFTCIKYVVKAFPDKVDVKSTLNKNIRALNCEIFVSLN